MKRYYVYILRCFDGSFYIGMTNNMDRRFGEHCVGLDKNCYTYNRRPLILAYAQEFGEVLDAINAEKMLKKWTHRKKCAFLEHRVKDLKRYAKGKERWERTSPPCHGERSEAQSNQRHNP